jgi:hypothetical protein
MEDVGPDKRHLVVSGLMSVFKKIWVDAWSARMEYILQNTILALLEYPGSTLVGVNRMLSDKDYRKLVVDNVKDPSVRSFWVDEFAKYNERYMQEAGDAIKNKIGQFTANPIIRNIIGQPKSSFDIRQIMDERKIIIMNLSKGLIGESNANLLGSMLTTRIYLAAMSRADLSPEKMREMPNFYFYVDEFQSFANATFANILSEARKYHLNLTIAHQYIEQMEEDVRNAVFGNVGTIVSFRVGPFDAEVLETIFTPQFLATDIVNLGFAQVYLTLMIDGIGSPPFSAVTLPPIAPQSVSFKNVVIGASREQYARPRSDVEADIVKFHEPVVLPPKEKRESPRGEDNPQKRNAVPTDNTNRERRDARERKEVHGDVRKQAQPRERNEREGERKDVQRTPTGEHQNGQKRGPQEQLTELRSLLQKVVTQEKKSVTDMNETSESPSTPPASVKESAPLVPRSQEESAPRRVAEPTRTQEETHTPTAPATPYKESLRVDSENSRGHQVTPKELERMMRVTGGDNSPL